MARAGFVVAVMVLTIIVLYFLQADPAIDLETATRSSGQSPAADEPQDVLRDESRPVEKLSEVIFLPAPPEFHQTSTKNDFQKVEAVTPPPEVNLAPSTQPKSRSASDSSGDEQNPGPTLVFKWPDSEAEKKLIWFRLRKAGARAVTIVNTVAGWSVSPVDGRSLRAVDYSPLVRVTGFPFMAGSQHNVVSVGGIRIGYLMPREFDQRLFGAIEAQFGTPVGALKRLHGRIRLSGSGVAVQVERIDGTAVHFPAFRL